MKNNQIALLKKKEKERFKALKEAFENLLVMANNKLQYAVNENKEWDIEHYTKDKEFVMSELKIVNTVLASGML